MPEEQSNQWPRFKLVTYSAPTGIPHGWDAELLEKGAPDGLVCEAAPELTLIEHPDSEITGKGHRAEEDEDARDERRFNAWSQAVLELEETLNRIDPMHPVVGGQFWGNFLADVGMGLYASENWLAPLDS